MLQLLFVGVKKQAHKSYWSLWEHLKTKKNVPNSEKSYPFLYFLNDIICSYKIQCIIRSRTWLDIQFLHYQFNMQIVSIWHLIFICVHIRESNMGKNKIQQSSKSVSALFSPIGFAGNHGSLLKDQIELSFEVDLLKNNLKY